MTSARRSPTHVRWIASRGAPLAVHAPYQAILSPAEGTLDEGGNGGEGPGVVLAPEDAAEGVPG